MLVIAKDSLLPTFLPMLDVDLTLDQISKAVVIAHSPVKRITNSLYFADTQLDLKQSRLGIVISREVTETYQRRILGYRPENSKNEPVAWSARSINGQHRNENVFSTPLEVEDVKFAALSNLAQLACMRAPVVAELPIHHYFVNDSYCASDRLPLVGALGKVPGGYVLAGVSGTNLLEPVYAKLLADHICGNKVDIDEFSPDRTITNYTLPRRTNNKA